MTNESLLVALDTFITSEVSRHFVILQVLDEVKNAIQFTIKFNTDLRIHIYLFVHSPLPDLHRYFIHGRANKQLYFSVLTWVSSKTSDKGSSAW